MSCDADSPDTRSNTVAVLTFGCGGQLRIIASIEEPEVIAKVLAHLERVAPEQYSAEWPLCARAPPSQSRLL